VTAAQQQLTVGPFPPLRTHPLRPQIRRFQECLWGSERKPAEVDTQGLEDPKLFVWPGKGVYAVFGRKPEALGSSPYCRNPIFVQFIVQVRGGWAAAAAVVGGVCAPGPSPTDLPCTLASTTLPPTQRCNWREVSST
jgi:hypothetical protein